MVLQAGTYAQARFELNPDQYEAAWEAVCGEWLPESGYQPDDGIPFERYLNDPGEHPEGKHIVEICIPVKPL
jgi:AraC family transcriptional regulator